MSDPTENVRRELVGVINSQVTSDDKDVERERLESEHGQVWNTIELERDFDVLGFMAPLIVVKRKSDGVKGSLFLQPRPRFYWGFEPDKG